MVTLDEARNIEADARFRVEMADRALRLAMCRTFDGAHVFIDEAREFKEYAIRAHYRAIRVIRDIETADALNREAP